MKWQWHHPPGAQDTVSVLYVPQHLLTIQYLVFKYRHQTLLFIPFFVGWSVFFIGALIMTKDNWIGGLWCLALFCKRSIDFYFIDSLYLLRDETEPGHAMFCLEKACLTWLSLTTGNFTGDQRWPVETGHGLPQSCQRAQLHDTDCNHAVRRS